MTPLQKFESTVKAGVQSFDFKDVVIDQVDDGDSTREVFADVIVYFCYHPGEAQTRNCPGEKEEVEIVAAFDLDTGEDLTDKLTTKRLDEMVCKEMERLRSIW